MDFIKNLALPQSLEQYHLLLFILNLTFLVFLPYLGFLLGSSFFSYTYNKRGLAEGNQHYLRFAKDLIDMAAFSKSGMTFLCILPAASLLFLYAQLLQATATIAVGVMTLGFLAVLVGTILIYAFKYTFNLGNVLKDLDNRLTHAGGLSREVAEYLKTNDATHLRSGRYGIAFLLAGSVLTVGTSALATNPATWGKVTHVLQLFLSPDFLVRLLQFLAIALGATGVGVLFFFFSWNSDTTKMDAGYAALVKQFALRWSSVGLLLLPSLLVLTLAVLPATAASGLMYGLAGAALLFLFAAAHFVYAFSREGQVNYTAYAFFAMVLALMFVFTKDQVAIGNGTQEHAARLALVYDKEVEELKARLGVAMKALTGQEIYDGKCSACHLFDQKKVGPPYKEVIPKYEGKKADLLAFILNPAKKNPEYPSMPNQGLKPNEADSIATYLLKKYAPATGQPVPTQAAGK